MIWYCKLEVVYRQISAKIKNTNDDHVKKKKNLFISSAYDEYRFESSESVDISSELDFEKYLGFHFLEGFEKRFEAI